MQPDDTQTIKKRPRAKTGTTFPSILRGRKSEPSQATPVSPLTQDELPSDLSLDQLIEALTPPIVPSLSHAKALVLLLQREIPDFYRLLPVITHLCSRNSLITVQAVGFDIISTYAQSATTSLSDLHRQALFTVVGSSDTGWASETWKPRCNCVSALTKEGSMVDGFEIPLLGFVEKCISSAYEGLSSDDQQERKSRERSIELLSDLVRKVLQKNGAVYTDEDFRHVVAFYEGFVQRSLENAPVGAYSGYSNNPVGGVAVGNVTHRRNTSSPSVVIPYSGSRPQPASQQPPASVDRSAFPAQIYITFLDMYRPKLPLEGLPGVISTLLRIFGVHLGPLSRLSASPIPQHPPRPIEASVLHQLFTLLSGPYADSVAKHIKRSLLAPNMQEAMGAFRAVRAVLRDSAGPRMALILLNRSNFEMDPFAPTGQMVLTEANAMLLEHAHRETLEVPALDLDRLCKPIAKSIRYWTTRNGSDKIVEEALAICMDLLTEAMERVGDKEGVESTSMMDEDEGRFLGAVLYEVADYMSHLRMVNRLAFLPIEKPSSAPTSFLVKLCTLLSLPLSTPLMPNLPSILLAFSPNLSDIQTAALPEAMHKEGFLTPASPQWLDNIRNLYTTLVRRRRPASAREVLSTIYTIHSDLRGVPLYRRQLGKCLCELAEQALDRELQGADVGTGMDGDEFAAKVHTNELAWRIIELAQDEGEEDDEKTELGLDQSDRIAEILKRLVSVPCPCCSTGDEEHYDAPSAVPPQEPISTPVSASHPISGSATPLLSRVSSGSGVHETDLASPQSFSTISSNVIPPIISMLPWNMPRKNDIESSTSPVTFRSETEVHTLVACRPFVASVALINVFQTVSFPAPPAPAFSIRLFNTLLCTLRTTGCPKAKLVTLQFLMRLRADRDHRLYIVESTDNDVQPLATLIRRAGEAVRDLSTEDMEQRARSTSRGFRKRGRPPSGAGSRSRSRPRPPPSISSRSRSKARYPLWSVPEHLPFDVPSSEPSSSGITTYEANAPSEWEELKHWLPVSDYVVALIDILKSDNSDWDILSYVLCHLPIQLANKHFLCGPKTKDGIISLFITLCTVTLKVDSAQHIADQLPDALKLRDAQGLVYHSLAVLISYKRIFDERKHHDLLVESFLAGLSSDPSTVKVCLNALSLCAIELPTSMTKHLTHILESLTRIMTNPGVAVHILDFVCIVGSIPALYANFREEEFRMVFAVAVSNIHYHNSPDISDESVQESFALSQHVLVMAYYIIYVWFLAVPLPDRPKHVKFLARRLLLANEAKGAVDEHTEVCFDWLARYTYASADPRPAYSMLGDVVMNPPEDGDERLREKPSSPKTWLWGNSLVSIRVLPKRGWIEVEAVRPSGETRFLCKLENFPQVGPGDVDPDRFSDTAILMSERDPILVEKNVPDPDDSQARDASTSSSVQRARSVFISQAPLEIPENRPDSVSGYVWSESAPSQRRKEVTIDPSYFALQLSQYPSLPVPAVRSRPVTGVFQLESLLRTLKRTPVIDTHKIAIIYVAPGQKTEKEILGNRHGSPAYTRFLESIGRLIRVRDQRDVYTGDMIPEMDGEYAYAWWDDIVQVVYHTATLMPELSIDPERTYKKRHIGNDKVRIVWNDSGIPYHHHTIPSQFNFVNIIVEPHSMGTIAAFSDDFHEREYFKVTMQCLEGMPEFGPIGEYKIVSAEGLGPFLRQVSLLADYMSEVYQATEKDTERQEYITNWRRRLQYINKFRERLAKEPVEEPESGLQDVRDFTRFF